MNLRALQICCSVRMTHRRAEKLLLSDFLEWSTGAHFHNRWEEPFVYQDILLIRLFTTSSSSKDSPRWSRKAYVPCFELCHSHKRNARCARVWIQSAICTGTSNPITTVFTFSTWRSLGKRAFTLHQTLHVCLMCSEVPKEGLKESLT